MADVFISYAREEQAFERRLHEALAARERNSWVDWEGIPPTAEWLSEIYGAIRSAQASVFVITPDWLASGICKLELQHAVDQGKRLIPILRREAHDSAVPEGLARLNWVMLRDSDDFDAGFLRLLEALDTDLDWVRGHTRVLLRANEWQTRQRDAAMLLRGGELAEAEAWLAGAASHLDPPPTPGQTEFIVASRAGAVKRQRTLLGSVLIALVVAVGLAVWAVFERGTAQRNETEARRQEGIATQAAAEAKRQEATAITQRDLAEQRRLGEAAARQAEAQQRKAAQAAERQALAERDEAVRQRRFAQARQLAARAEFMLGSDPALTQLAVLLAAESLRLLPNVEADQVLRRAVATLAPPLQTLAHGGIDGPLRAASDGEVLVVGDPRGVVRVFDLGGNSGMTELRQHRIDDRIERVALSPGAAIVAVQGRRSGVHLFERDSGREIVYNDCEARGFAFSGPLLAIACERSVSVVDTRSWGPLRKLERPALPAVSFSPVALAFSPDGQRIAALAADADVRVWSVQGEHLAWINGQEYESSRSSSCCVGSLVFSPSGEHLATANLQRRDVRVIETKGWTLRVALQHQAQVNALAFDDEREVLATGAADGRVRLWDMEGRVLLSASHAADVTQIKLRLRASPGEAAWLASASTDRTVRLWDPRTGAEIVRANLPAPAVWAGVARQRLVSADATNAVASWGMVRDEVPPRVAPASDRNATLAVCADAASPWWVFAHPRGAVAISPDRQRQRQPAYFGSGVGASALAFDAGCKRLAALVGGALQVHDVASGQLVHSDNDPVERSDIAFSPGGGFVTVQPPGRASVLWSTAPWRRVPQAFEGCAAEDLRFSSDDRLLAYHCAGQTVLKQTAGWRTLGSFTRETNNLQFLPGAAGLVLVRGQRIVVLAPDGLHERASAALPAGLVNPSLVLSADGRYVLLGAPGMLAVWQVAGLRPVAHEVLSAAKTRDFEERQVFSPDGGFLLALSSARIRVYATQPWRMLHELEITGQSGALAFDSVHQRLAASVAYTPPQRETQYSAHVWSLASGAEIARLPLQREARQLRFSPDGGWLLADRLHVADAGELTRQACRLLTRNLTPREWQREVGSGPWLPTCERLPRPGDGEPDWQP